MEIRQRRNAAPWFLGSVVILSLILTCCYGVEPAKKQEEEKEEPLLDRDSRDNVVLLNDDGEIEAEETKEEPGELV